MNLDDISFRGRGLIWRLLHNPEVIQDQSCTPYYPSANPFDKAESPKPFHHD
jgi:hypothetical protein